MVQRVVIGKSDKVTLLNDQKSRNEAEPLLKHGMGSGLGPNGAGLGGFEVHDGAGVGVRTAPKGAADRRTFQGNRWGII